MDKNYYDMIYKRKSFRRYKSNIKISENDLTLIHEKISGLIPLIDNIKTDYTIVNVEETTAKRGDYCILIYSEDKEGYLLNVGYMFEQLDLYLASINIGVCWYGMGKTVEKDKKGLKYVIMMTIGKALDDEFRKDYKKAKRKDIKDTWEGEHKWIGDIAKYAPSACNSQPWRVKEENNIISVYRLKNVKCIIPIIKIPFYNSIDMGIYLLILEQVFSANNIDFKRKIINEDITDKVKIAEYAIDMN